MAKRKANPRNSVTAKSVAAQSVPPSMRAGEGKPETTALVGPSAGNPATTSPPSPFYFRLEIRTGHIWHGDRIKPENTANEIAHSIAECSFALGMTILERGQTDFTIEIVCDKISLHDGTEHPVFKKEVECTAQTLPVLAAMIAEFAFPIADELREKIIHASHS